MVGARWLVGQEETGGCCRPASLFDMLERQPGGDFAHQLGGPMAGDRATKCAGHSNGESELAAESPFYLGRNP